MTLRPGYNYFFSNNNAAAHQMPKISPQSLAFLAGHASPEMAGEASGKRGGPSPYPGLWGRMPEPASQLRKREPVAEEVDEEMTVGDVIHVLQHLGFVNGQGLLLLDRGVRDYLVRALRQR